MADKKDSPPSLSFEAFEIIVLLILLSTVASAVVNLVNRYQSVWTSFWNNLPFYLINIYTKYVVFAIFLSIVLFILVIIYTIREQEIKQKLMSRVLPKDGEVKTGLENIVMVNPKWKLVEEHINSNDANKWKLAILEADIILSELLESLNLPGEGVGEKLKSVEVGDFDHIEEAWEAHKIRNAIAHEGSDFLLTQREANRITKLYESVFKEFEII